MSDLDRLENISLSLDVDKCWKVLKDSPVGVVKDTCDVEMYNHEMVILVG